MKNPFRLKNYLVIWSCILILPPLGLLLLWMRRESRLRTKGFGFLAAIAFSILHLYLFWGFKVELDGGVTRPIITFRSSEKHYKEIEKRHKEDRSVDASQMIAPLSDANPSQINNIRAIWM